MMDVKSCLSGFIVILVILFCEIGISDLYAKDSQPWLDPMNPSKLEWLALQKQADEGDTEFGENGLTVNFYLGDKSYETGVIYCDIDYLPGTSACGLPGTFLL
jgi:hypothetical protein